MTPSQTIEDEPTRTQSFAEWFQANTRAVGIGAVIVLLAAAGFWFYQRSNEIKRQNAERGLNQAKQSLAVGNTALAQSDLQRVATRYKGTPSGAQAALILAQLDYDLGKVQDGIQVLEPYTNAGAAGPLIAEVWSLYADGQEMQGKPADAAASYEKAADAVRSLPNEWSLYLAKAGRAYMTAGKADEARSIWQKLATDPDAAPVQNEAKIRLGELEAKPVGS